MTKEVQRRLGGTVLRRQLLAVGEASMLLAVFSILAASTAASAAPVQTFRVLYSFSGPPDGIGPAALIRDSDGNLYGMTQTGGTGPCTAGCGTIFKVDASGSESVLYNFMGNAEGSIPTTAALARDNAGNLYGTTFQGGTIGGDCGTSGCGIVFRLNTDATLTVLHRFAGGTDGTSPSGGVIRDVRGNLYGITEGNGVSLGTVFKLDASGKETILYTFKGGSEGGIPFGGLSRDAKGNLYGSTTQGGDLTCSCGAVFKLSSDGKLTVLHRFHGYPTDGAQPFARLLEDQLGNLYGTTYTGGSSSNCENGCGTVFWISKSAEYRVLYSFTGGADGANPEATLVHDRSGNLYGTTETGGTYFSGTVFKLGSKKGIKTIYSFAGEVDGLYPFAGVVRDPNGTLYGTTFYGGSGSCSFGCGVLFTIVP